MGAPLEVSDARVSFIIERMARSATPLSWCMCGGQVVLCTPRDARKSPNSFDKNSPALLLCRVLMTCFGWSLRLFSKAVKEAMKRRTCAGALALFLRK
eukprot:6203792-Pleurochrysis_carterae.AAC.1